MEFCPGNAFSPVEPDPVSAHVVPVFLELDDSAAALVAVAQVADGVLFAAAQNRNHCCPSLVLAGWTTSCETTRNEKLPEVALCDLPSRVSAACQCQIMENHCHHVALVAVAAAAFPATSAHGIPSSSENPQSTSAMVADCVEPHALQALRATRGPVEDPPASRCGRVAAMTPHNRLSPKILSLGKTAEETSESVDLAWTAEPLF